jgi:hypothetical protein
MHDSCTIAGFAWFETLHRGEAFHEEFCAWLYERVRQSSPAVSRVCQNHHVSNFCPQTWIWLTCGDTNSSADCFETFMYSQSGPWHLFRASRYLKHKM